MINVYNSVILPYFDYCSMVWENCGNCALQRLQKMQNRAARVITEKSYEVRSSEILRELDWQTLEKRRKCNKAIFMYKIKHTNEPPQCMANLFNVKNNTRYNLRSNNIDFSLEMPRTNMMKRGISYSAASLWNQLPGFAKLSNVPLHRFKAILWDSLT